MNNNKYEKEKFEYYIDNRERKKREKIYVLITIIIGIAFELLVYAMHVNFPSGMIAGIPVFAVAVWTLILAHYILFLILGGAWVLLLKDDDLKDWNK